MVKVTLAEITEIVDGKLEKGNANQSVNMVSIDSRDIMEDCLFVPIKGQRFDGHNFIEKAKENGAVATLTEVPMAFKEADDMGIISVEDTLKAYHALANWVRRSVDIPVVAVTGSSGKTTTKEMLFTVLNNTNITLKNIGNLNNEIGVPKTVLRLEQKHAFAVIEMGMNHEGEIRTLSAIAEPDIGVITNIGVSHIENLGSRENIFKAKMELVESMTGNGPLIVNGDDDFLCDAYFTGGVITYGIENDSCDFRADNIKYKGIRGIEYTLVVNREYIEKIVITQPGKYNVYNSLAAIAVGMCLNIPLDSIKRSIKAYKPEKMRFNILNNNGIYIIDDTYNANPESVVGALKATKDLKETRLVAVLGDMLELGDYALKGHQQVGKCAATLQFDYLFVYGEASIATAQAAIDNGMHCDVVKSFDDKECMHDELKKVLKKNDIVLVKGSRGMKMEETVKYLTSNIL